MNVSIPFIAGQWSLRDYSYFVIGRSIRVSIPFIAGQWSLHAFLDSLAVFGVLCFNPLHCGAVVASGELLAWVDSFVKAFQSPSLRGSGRFNRWFHIQPKRRKKVSIPFIAGQWSLQGVFF